MDVQLRMQLGRRLEEVLIDKEDVKEELEMVKVGLKLPYFKSRSLFLNSSVTERLTFVVGAIGHPDANAQIICQLPDVKGWIRSVKEFRVFCTFSSSPSLRLFIRNARFAYLSLICIF